MAELLLAADMLPVYLIFSTISLIVNRKAPILSILQYFIFIQDPTDPRVLGRSIWLQRIARIH